MALSPCDIGRLHRAARKAAFEHGGGGFPAELRCLARHQQAVLAQALHQRADDFDSRSRQCRQCGHRFFITALCCEAEQRRFAELAGRPETCDGALGAFEIADTRHLALDTDGDCGDRALDLLEQMRRRARQQAGPHGLARRAQQLTAQV